MIKKIDIKSKFIKGVIELFDNYRVFYNKESDISAAEIFVLDRIKNDESVIYAFVEEDEVIGFVQLYPFFSSTQMKRLWLLNDLYVSEVNRGKGVSKALIEAAQNLCIETGAAGLMLETAKDNIIGNKLYKQTNFILDSDHNYYYWTNC